MSSFTALFVAALAVLATQTSPAACGYPEAPVELGVSGEFAILTKSGITNVADSAVTGDVGASPISGTAILLTCPEVDGIIYSVDPAGPEPCKITNSVRLTAAVGDMGTAYTDAAGRVDPDFTEKGAGEIGGETLTPGLYKWGSTVSINADVMLNGGPNDVYIFQIAGDLVMAANTEIQKQPPTVTAAGLTVGGVRTENIFWQVAGAVTIGVNSHFEGVTLCSTAINVRTEASINGRLLAQTEVTLQKNTITEP